MGGSFEYVGMDVLVPLPKTKQGNLFFIARTDRYTRLTKAILTPKTTTTTVACKFLKHWVSRFGITSDLLTDDGQQFVSRFFVPFYSMLGVNNIADTEYQPQKNGQAERYNSTIVLRLRHYVSEHQTNWNTYLLSLTYAYNAQMRGSIKLSTFSLALWRILPGPTIIVSKRLSLASDKDAASPLFARLELIR